MFFFSFCFLEGPSVVCVGFGVRKQEQKKRSQMRIYHKLRTWYAVWVDMKRSFFSFHCNFFFAAHVRRWVCRWYCCVSEVVRVFALGARNVCVRFLAFFCRFRAARRLSARGKRIDFPVALPFGRVIEWIRRFTGVYHIFYAESLDKFMREGR